MKPRYQYVAVSTTHSDLGFRVDQHMREQMQKTLAQAIDSGRPARPPSKRQLARMAAADKKAREARVAELVRHYREVHGSWQAAARAMASDLADSEDWC